MIWLQNSERFDEIAHVQPDGGPLRIVSRMAIEDEPKTSGFYSMLGTVLVALYGREDGLAVRVGDLVVPVSRTLRATVDGPPSARRLRLRLGTTIVSEVAYSLPTRDSEEIDPTAFVEEEDLDFGLFVANVCKDRKRQVVLLHG